MPAVIKVVDGRPIIRIGDAAIEAAFLAQQAANAAVGDIGANKANAVALGVTGADGDMGAFTSPLLPDNATAKGVFDAIGAKIEQIRAVPDFTTPAAADAAGGALFTPTVIETTVANGSSLDAVYWGDGQIQTADGNKRGKFFSNITAPPSSVGAHDSIETAFNGDLSKSVFQVEHRITGAGTLGQPASGYTYTPEAFPFYGVIYNSSGHNEATGGNGGRTGAAFFRVAVRQYGQGDLACYNGTAFVTGAKPGATHFLANPAAVLFNGDMTAGQSGVYLNPREIFCDDNGYDVACIGDVVNFNRTVGTGALSCWWGAYRAQNQGSAAPDNVLSAAGEWKCGLDFSMTDFGANKAAVSLKSGDRIYFNSASSNGNFTTSVGDYWIEYSSGALAMNFVAGNGSVMQVRSDYVNFLKPLKHTPVASSALPSAAGLSGMEYYVTDATATTRLSILAGGGANFVKVFSNGTNWLIQ